MSQETGWFKRVKEGITTETKDKKETPEGLWYKCPECGEVVTTEDHMNSYWVCKKCQYHEKISAENYFDILFDDHKYKEIAANLTSGDPLNFVDTKKYADRIKDTIKKSGLKDAIKTAYGKVDGQELVISAMDFGFIGGSMGSVVGEIGRASCRERV